MDVVIGGGSGIGAAVVPKLPGPVLVADLVGAEVTCDLTDPASIEALVARVDRLGALVVTAGVSPAQAPAATILDVDLAGTVRALDAFDGLIGDGTVVVLVASMAGHMATWPDETMAALDEPLTHDLSALTDDPASAYLMAKLGVIRLVRHRAVAYGRRGARIVSVSPGVVHTPMGDLELAAGTGAQGIVDGCALARPAAADEIASAIAFLCSPAASYVTGTDLVVDGGSLASLGMS